jgi:hypothetical protein
MIPVKPPPGEPWESLHPGARPKGGQSKSAATWLSGPGKATGARVEVPQDLDRVRP